MKSYFLRLKQNAITTYNENGIKGLLGKIPVHSRYVLKHLLTPEQNYTYWLKKNEQRIISEFVEGTDMQYQPKISIITPVYNVPTKYLKEAVRSVKKQTYTNWQLCLHNDASTKNLQNIQYMKKLAQQDERIRFSSSEVNENISGASNQALKLADGEYFIILDNDDTLHPMALELLVRKLNSNRKLRYIYTDEDKMEIDGKRCEPIMKPDWAPHYTMSMMYTTHISMFETKLIKEIGGFRKGFEAAQDYDLLLRYTEKIEPSEIGHISIPLYHWRKIPGSTAVDYDAKGAAKTSARKALQEAIIRRGIDAAVVDGLTKPSFKIKYKIKGEPLVSIIIPTYNYGDVLKTCIDSILQKTTYQNYEIIVINNNSNEEASLEYLKEVDKSEKVSVYDYPHPFNFSEINNFGVTKAKGEHLLFLNNDMEVINGEWLGNMLELSQLPEVGAVGAMLLYPNNTYQHTGIVLGIGGVAGHSFRERKRSDAGYLGQAHTIRNVSAVTAACLMIKRSIFEEVSGLNEGLRVAFNDVDFCLDVDKAGYYNLYTPFAKLYHYESLSRGSDQDPKRRTEFKKEIDYMKKKWGRRLYNDPYYNINLTLKYEDFTLKTKEG